MNLAPRWMICMSIGPCLLQQSPAAGPQISQHEKVNKSRPRYVVFTQGPDPTIIAVEGKVCPKTDPDRDLNPDPDLTPIMTPTLTRTPTSTLTLSASAEAPFRSPSSQAVWRSDRSPCTYTGLSVAHYQGDVMHT